MIEVWREINIPSIAGKYQISNLGRVRNKSGKILYQSTSNSGYLFVSLTGKHHKFYIHRLLAEMFIGPLGELEVNHKDGNKRNNSLENLEIVTSSQNLIHKYKVLNQKVWNIKLSKAQAREIRKIYSLHQISQKKLGEQFGVSAMLINRIINKVQYEYR